METLAVLSGRHRQLPTAEARRRRVNAEDPGSRTPPRATSPNQFFFFGAEAQDAQHGRPERMFHNKLAS